KNQLVEEFCKIVCSRYGQKTAGKMTSIVRLQFFDFALRMQVSQNTSDRNYGFIENSYSRNYFFNFGRSAGVSLNRKRDGSISWPCPSIPWDYHF
ncbi:MAG: hypothetical protein PVH26_02075, partial [Desulfosarcina sp.]